MRNGIEMNILALYDPQVDFLADGLLCGLWEQPAVDVFEWFAWNHVRGGVDQGYILPDKTKGFTSTPGYLSNPLPPNPHTQEEILQFCKDEAFDLIILLSHREYAIRALREILEQTGKAAQDLPLVYCDGEDAASINTKIIQEFQPKVLFKRELLKKAYNGKFSPDYLRLPCPVYPCPFSAFTRSYPEDIDDTQKDNDIFLSLGITYPRRNDLLATFLEYGVQKHVKHYIATNHDVLIRNTHPYKEHFQSMLGWHDYIKAQAHSKITASIRGWGRDALHAWEAFSYATFVLYCDPGIWIPYPFKDGVHCRYFDELCDTVPALLDLYLREHTERWRMALAGKVHCRQWHTNKARAAYLISITMKVLGGEKINLEEFGL